MSAALHEHLNKDAKRDAEQRTLDAGFLAPSHEKDTLPEKPRLGARPGPDPHAEGVESRRVTILCRTLTNSHLLDHENGITGPVRYLHCLAARLECVWPT